MQFMRSVCSAMHQQQLGAGLAGNHPLRALVCGAYFVQRFRVRAPPPPPGVPEKRAAAHGTGYTL